MDLDKYFSDLEYNEQPYTYFIGHFGFTIAGVMEKLQNLNDEKSVLIYLMNLRDRLIKITQDLQPHSISRFLDIKTVADPDTPGNVLFVENKAYSESKKEYDNYLNDLNLVNIENKVVRTILEDIKTDNRDVDVLSLISEFGDFILWLERLIRKITVMNEIYIDEEIENDYQVDEKIVWMKKKEDFLALFNKLFELGFFSYKKNKYQLLAKHFCWPNEEIDPEKLRHLKNNIINKKETHQISDELKNLKFD